MKRNKRRKRKLFDPSQVLRQGPPHPVVTLVQWTVWLGMAGLLVAFMLIATLYLRWQVPNWVWQYAWPPSSALMGEVVRTPRRELLIAYALAFENALIYAFWGLLLGAVQVGFRRLRRAWRESGGKPAVY